MMSPLHPLQGAGMFWANNKQAESPHLDLELLHVILLPLPRLARRLPVLRQSPLHLQPPSKACEYVAQRNVVTAVAAAAAAASTALVPCILH
jgi:hypothetical protein